MSAQLSSALSITLVLFLVSLAALLIFKGNELSNFVKENLGFSIIIESGTTKADIEKLSKTLELTGFVRTIEFIDKNQAAQELSQQLGEDFTGYLGYNPLYDELNIKLKAQYANSDSLANIKKRVSKLPYINEVIFQESLIEKVNENINYLSQMILSVALVFFIMAYSLVSNTVRLIVFSNRFKIRTMQLIGATPAFILSPYLIQGVIKGFVASVLALIILTVVVRSVEQAFPSAFSFEFGFVFPALVILLGTALTVASYFFAVRKYSLANPNELY